MFVLHSLRLLSFVALFVLACHNAAAGEEDEIVTGCHFSNAEWGTEAIHRCIEVNRATRALVLSYPAQYKRIVDRCRQMNEYGWDWVKICVDRDIEAEVALTAYPSERIQLIDACQREFAHLGTARVKACVDELLAAPSSPRNN